MTDTTTTTYMMRVLGRTGMYTYGEPAGTSELAKLATGSLIRSDTDRLAIYSRDLLPGLDYYGCSDGLGRARYTTPVLVEVESAPGEWTIGPRA